jgi:adenylate cyclase
VTLTAAREGNGGGGKVTFAISDTGIGISLYEQAKLFQDFSQADSSTTRRYGGTGLGLAISQRLCGMMGGTISMESRVGVGTTFTVELPANNEATTGGPRPSSPSSPAAGGSGDAVTNIVLVVDDDETVRDQMRRFFVREGCDVVTARDGAEALSLARQLKPALITLDVLMPGADGWSVLQDLKRDQDLQAIPVVMVTIADERNRGHALGAAEYLVKPVDPNELRKVLSRFRRHSQSLSQLRVLIVDDDETARLQWRRALAGEGCLIDEAENGKMALERLGDTRPDLILLDLMMPEMNGFEFLVELRKIPACTALPVVVVTAASLTEEDHQLLNSSVESVLAKSDHTRDELLDELRQIAARYVFEDRADG